MIEDAIKLVGGLIRWINETREARRRDRTWTLAQEEAYQKNIEEEMKKSYWQPRDDQGS